MTTTPLPSSKLDGLKSRVQTSMHSHPMKWAGVAAGAGFALGLIGRLLQKRTTRSQPDLIVIETC